jgi:transcriptional regulator with XRE-family HTH domain
VPEDFWQRPDVQEAITHGEFGRLSLLVRQRSGLRQSDMAVRTGLSQGFLSQLEQGRRRLTRLDSVAAFLAGIGTPDGLIPSPLREHTAVLHSPPRSAAPLGELTDRAGAPHGDSDMRDIATNAALQGLRFAEEMATTNVTDLEVADLEATIARLAKEYVHTPVRRLFKEMVVTRDRLFHLLKGRQFPRQTQALYLLAGVSSLLLAHASQNLGDEDAALAQLQTAWTLAEHTRPAHCCGRGADSDDLRAWVKGTVALIAEWSTEQHAALEYTQHALQFATTGETRARIAAIEARTAARLGNRDRALRALDELRRARESGTEGRAGLQRFGGILTFPEAKQEYYIGGTYILLGEYDLAEQHSARALHLYEHGPTAERSYGDEALARLNIATGHIATGEAEGAQEHLRTLFELPQEQRIKQLGDAMRGVAALLTGPRWAGSPLARSLADEARTYSSSGTRTKVIGP